MNWGPTEGGGSQVQIIEKVVAQRLSVKRGGSLPVISSRRGPIISKKK